LDLKAQVLRLGLPDKFIDHGAPAIIYDLAGLSAPKIYQRTAEWMGKSAAKKIEPAPAASPR